MHRILVLFAVIAVGACAPPEATTPSDRTMDSGRPLSPGLQSYEVDHYTLRNDIRIDEKAIAGSVSIRFTAVEEVEVLASGPNCQKRLSPLPTDASVNETVSSG